MMDSDYTQLLIAKFAEFGELLKARQHLDVQISKLKQFIFATINMLPDEERAKFRKQINDLSATVDAQAAGLTDSIRRILDTAYPKHLTVSVVRDRLEDAGFDFTGYTSNPLATIGTILRRMVPKEAEVTENDGVSAYRRKQQRALPDRLKPRWERAASFGREKD